MAFDPGKYELLDTTPEPSLPDKDVQVTRAMTRLQEDYGWPAHVAAGIVGNLWHESAGGQPGIWGDRGSSFGLAQWNGPRRRTLAEFATERGKPADDFDTQIDFLHHELGQDYPNLVSRLHKTSSPSEAAELFSNIYERPGVPAMQSRIAHAERAFKLAKKVAGPVPKTFDPSKYEVVVEDDTEAFDPARYEVVEQETGPTWGNFPGWQLLPKQLYGVGFGERERQEAAARGWKAGWSHFYDFLGNIVMLTGKAADEIGPVAAAAHGDLELGESQVYKDVAKPIEDYLRGIAELVAPKVQGWLWESGRGFKKGAVPDTGPGTLQTKIFEGLGSAPAAITQYMLGIGVLGPIGGMAAVDAISAADKGGYETVKAAVQGAVMGTGFKAIEPAALLPRLSALGAMGAMQAKMAGGDAKDVTASAVTLALLGLSAHGGNKSAKELLSDAWGQFGKKYKRLQEQEKVELEEWVNKESFTDRMEGLARRYEEERAATERAELSPEVKAPLPDPEAVQSEVDKLLTEYRAGQEHPILTENLPPEVLEQLRAGTKEISPVYLDKLERALVGERSYPEMLPWEKHGFAPVYEAGGVVIPPVETPETRATGAKPEEVYRREQEAFARLKQAQVEEEGVTPMGATLVPGMDKLIDKARQGLGKLLKLDPSKLEYKGIWKGEPGVFEDQYMFDVTDPEHPQYKSTAVWPVREDEPMFATIFPFSIDKMKSVLDWIRTGKVSGKQLANSPYELFMPGIEALTGAKKGFQSLLLPTAKSRDHLAAAEVLGSALGTMNRAGEGARKALRGYRKLFNKAGVHDKNLSPDKNLGLVFMSDLSVGREVPENFGLIRDKIDELFKQRLQQLEDVGAPLDTVRDNYFPGMWTSESRKALSKAFEELGSEGFMEGKETDLNLWSHEDKAVVRDRVNQLLNTGNIESNAPDAVRYLSRRPLRGYESFRKGKVFEDIMTGAEFGLESISANPIDLVFLKLAEMDRSVMANRALREWEKKGDVKFISVTEEVPEGWQQINDRYGVVFGKFNPGTMSKPIRGYMIAKTPIAEVMNNYLSSTLYNSPYFGHAYKALMGIGNTLNQAQLGVFSLFHGGFTSIETQITKGAEIYKDIYGLLKGNRGLGQLLKNVAEYPIALVKPAIEGSRVLAEWNNPATDIPANVPVEQLPQNKEGRVAQIAKAAELAGAGFRLEQGLRTHQTDRMIADWFGGRKIRAALRSPIALTELGAKPIMEFLVPRQKAGVFAELAGRIIEQNPDKSLEELRPQLRQAWNRVDARLGQVRYNRLFVNNVAKNVVQAAMRAPGWTFGTIAEVGGSAKDAGMFIRDWIRDGRAPDNLPDRVAYTMSLFTTVALTNGLLTYAFTGTSPEGIDYLAFRDGSTDEWGNPTRWVLPTYMRDLYNWYSDPKETATAKAHPLVSAAGELWRNKDYTGEVIVDPEADLAQQFYELTGFAARQFIPFWMRGVGKALETQEMSEAPQKVAAPLLGIMPAGAKYTRTGAQDMILDYYKKRGQKEFFHEEAELNRSRSKITKLMMKGKEDKALDLVAELVADKKVTLDKATDWLLRTGSGEPLSVQRFKKLPLDWMVKVLGRATPDEQAQLLSALVDRIDRAAPEALEEALPELERYLAK